MGKHLTQKDFLERCKERVDSKLYDFSSAKYISYKTTVDILCKRCNNIFKITPDSLLSGKGCYPCNKKIAVKALTKTHEQYISECEAHYGTERFDYSNTVYKSVDEKINVRCIEHDTIFTMTARNHVRGSVNCKQCMKNANKKRQFPIEYYMKVLREHYRESCDLSKTIIRRCTDIDMYCNTHGEFNKGFTQLKQKQGCPQCHLESGNGGVKFDQDYFIEESKKIHGDRYDYSLVDYVNARTRVTLICKNHGNFLITPHSHLRLKANCRKCVDMENAKNQSFSTEQFIEKAKGIHGDRYDYSKVNYVNSKHKILIGCRIHGFWETLPPYHTGGLGCRKCSRKVHAEKMKENPVGWSYTAWEKASKRSKYFDSYKVYIIKCKKDSEEFYKIGRTYSSLSRRFRGIPYKYEILNTIEFESARECCEYEQKLKNEHSEHKYLPNLKFGGMYECFSNIYDELITL